MPARLSRTAVAISAVCVTALAACSTDQPAPNAPDNSASDAAASSSPSSAAGGSSPSTSGTNETPGPATSLSQPLKDATPPAIAAKIMSCAESDMAMPIMFGSEAMHGFTCLLPMESGAVAMMTAAQDQAVVDRIANEAEGVEGYAPLDIPGMTAFRGQRGGTSFVMSYLPEQGIYEEYACGGVPNEQADACINEIVSGLGG